MNLPNKLTFLRLILIPVFVAVFYLTVIPYNYIIAAAIFAFASFTDYLDGHIARKRNLVTNLGKFLDPIADKVLVATALIIMLIPSNGKAILPWYAGIAVAIIIARELIISGFRIIAAGKGVVLAADMSGKVKTCFQDGAILALLIGASVMPEMYSVINIIGLVGLGIAAVLTLVSGIEYFVKNPGVLKDEVKNGNDEKADK